MSWLKDRIRELTVTKRLRFPPGAVITVNSGTASESDVTIAEQTVLDGVTAGTVKASKAVVVDANKDIGDFRNVDVVNLDAGASGTAGSVDIFPATAAKGKVAITAADNTGDTTTGIAVAAQAGARTLTVPDPGASASFVMTEGAQTINGNKTFGGSIIRASQQRVINTGAKVGATAGWSLGGGAVNTGLTATLPASQTASTLVIPIPGLKVGDTITAFSLVGQIESAGGAVTLDADLRKHTAAAADVTDASVGAITQVSVTADAIVSASKAALAEVVAADETFYVLLTGTTAAVTDIALQGITVTVTES